MGVSLRFYLLKDNAARIFRLTPSRSYDGTRYARTHWIRIRS
jgi:hypothetical protein